MASSITRCDLPGLAGVSSENCTLVTWDISELVEMVLGKASLPNKAGDPFCSASSTSTLRITSFQILLDSYHRKSKGGTPEEEGRSKRLQPHALSTHLNAFNANARFSSNSRRIPPLSLIIWYRPSRCTSPAECWLCTCWYMTREITAAIALSDTHSGPDSLALTNSYAFAI